MVFGSLHFPVEQIRAVSSPRDQVEKRSWGMGFAQGTSRITRRFGRGIAACGTPSALC